MDNLKTVAGEALETIDAIAKSASQRLGERGLTFDSMATVNHATAEVLAKRMQDRNLERSGNLLQLRQKPAIARLEVADEDDNIEVIYITPNAEISIAGIKICSYLNNEGKGRLASLPIGEGAEINLRGGARYFEVRQRLTFEPVSEFDTWDSRPAIQFQEKQPPLTIKSLRALLREDGFSHGELDELERMLAEADAADNVVLGIQRSVLTAMQMRVQPLLDQYQNEIFRLPLDSRLAILGPPGSGKTTTLIKRLRQKLDFAYLEREERDLVGASGPNGLDHAHSWLLFTPTTLLKEYVKAAFSKEDVPVADERIQTWEDYRPTIARRNLPILRSGRRNGMVPKLDAGILKKDTALKQIEWFEAFNQFQKTLFFSELRDAASILSNADDKKIAAVGAQIETALDYGQDRPSRLLFELVRPLDEMQKLLTASREETRQNLRTILASAVRGDKVLLDALAKYIAAMTPENEEELDDPDGDDDDDEIVPQRGVRAAESAFYKALRARAVAGITKRFPSKGSRNAQILAWLDTRSTALPSLSDIGVRILLQKAMTQISKAPSNYVVKIPMRYRRFRREAASEGQWYASLLGAADVDPLELDIIILAMLRAAKEITGDAQLMRRLSDKAPAILDEVAGLLRHQILVDEATDFSPVQLACMAAMTDSRTESFFAIGDFNQRLTTWGTRSKEELRWLFPDIDIREINIVYRQSEKLNDFANVLANPTTHADTGVLPKFLENEGVPPVLGTGLDNLQRLAEWMASRIREIERFSEMLPSIAVLVNSESELQPLADALNTALAEQAIRVIPCPKGQAVGPENDVRIFEVKHIKGLEFEAIFFVDIDELAKQEPELFERYIYVGATRAATFLGLTCSGNSLPASMASVSDLLVEHW